MHYVIDVNKSISCQVSDKWLVLWSLLSTILIASFCSKMCFIITAVDHHLVDISALNLCMGRFCCNLLSIHCFFANFEKKQQQSFDIFLIQHPLLISHHQGPCLLLNLSYGQNNLEFANQVVHMPVLYWYNSKCNFGCLGLDAIGQVKQLVPPSVSLQYVLQAYNVSEGTWHINSNPCR